MSALRARVPRGPSTLRASGRLLAVLTLLVLPLASARGQPLVSPRGQPTQAPTDDRLPLSFSGYAAYSRGLDEGTSSLAFAGTLNVRRLSTVDLGIGMRTWHSRRGSQGCSDGVCVFSEDTDALGALVFASVNPFRNRAVVTRHLFARLGMGLMFIRERTALDSAIQERNSRAFTLLFGFGWDLPVGSHTFVTPTVEIMRSFVHDEALRSTTNWNLQFGLGATIG